MRKLGILGLALGSFAFACGSEPSVSTSAPGVEPDDATPAQLRAFAALKSDTHAEWTWLQHEKTRSVMHLSGSRTTTPILAAGGSAEAATVAFLGRYRDLFRMHDAASELRIEKSEVDELSMTHARFQQVSHGISVEGAELTAHYDAAGRLTSIDSNYVPDVDGIDVEPKIGADAALLAATMEISPRAEGRAELAADEGKLVIYARDGHPATLAYRFSVREEAEGDPAIWITTIDAKTGAVIDRYNDIQTIEATGAGVLGDSKKFQVTRTGNTYTLTDSTRGAVIRTSTANNAQTIPGAAITSTTLSTWDRTPTGAGAAVDAHFNATIVYDYYKAKHARNAINGAGGAMSSTAHYGNNYDNAFWDSQRQQMAYGDGGTRFRPLSASLDVVAHEFTHGVTFATSKLTYQGQSGALNESVSDIFGALIEHATKPDDVNNWRMGETIAKASPQLRDMRNPAANRQPAHMRNFVNTQQDNGGVHINSGIPNNAAFLMTVGGKNPVSNTEVKYGIGWEKSEKLWYRANSRYFMASTNFAQGAQGVMQAAKDLGLTQNEVNIIDCAWKATGVVQGACATLTDPKGTPAPPPSPAPSTPSTTEPPAPTGPGTTDDVGGSGGQSEEPSTALPQAAPQDSGGCTIGTTGGASSTPIAALFAAVLGLSISRRRRAPRA